MARTNARYRLVKPPVTAATAPVLDDAQQAVVRHRGGPLLVLAGPGTGKTTTLVEAVIDRIRHGHDPSRQGPGVAPSEVLALTFSRRAAAELRDRITVRLGRSAVAPTVTTFHSFCYGLVRQYQPADVFAYPLRLLSGPEQEVAVRELLSGSVDTGRVHWPQLLRDCLHTRGLTEEVRDVIARTRNLALDPRDLRRIGADTGDRKTWSALATFVEEYLDTLDSLGALDYAELVHRAVLLVEQASVRAELRERFSAVFVDEYQDTDPAQVRLLAALAGDGRELVVVGDPDQSIYAFRGADRTGILDFPGRFRQLDGRPATVLALHTSRRAGAVLLAASRRLTERMRLNRMHAHLQVHRELATAPGIEPGMVAVRTYPSLGAELEAVADVLRRAHLEDGIPWREMAVLVRSGRRSVPVTRRVLGAAGVPVEVAGDELPLRLEPAVAPLLLALRCAADESALTEEAVRVLLLSPLGGADAADLRRLGRALRAEERLAAAAGGGTLTEVAGSAALIREAVAKPEILASYDDRVAAPAVQLGRLLAEARRLLTEGGAPGIALWQLWSGTRWPYRLRRAAELGGPAGARADRDLDAVCALFHAAERAEERAGYRGALNFIAEVEAQQIPGDTLAERAVRGEGVRLLTAHRAKGLEWRLVVVTGVQEGGWPDLRQRGSLLSADRIGATGLAEPPTLAEILGEERRLFYVAVTRAKERLLVTAVRSPDDDGDQPSRFLDEVGIEPVHVLSRPARPMTMSGLVAELRAVAVDPEVAPELRRAAAARLGLLAAQAGDDGHPLIPAAHPDRWWGMAELTDPGQPVRDPQLPLRLSGSAVAALRQCPLRWFLSREAHGESARTTALGFGSLVHALAAEVGSGTSEPELDGLVARLDRVWGQLAFEAPWQSVQQRDHARLALERFLRWHLRGRGRTTLAVEHPFEVQVKAGETAVALNGRMDRVELDDDGRVHVIDFKTGKSKVAESDLAEHPQLGVYQLAVAAGALARITDAPEGDATDLPGGAELVHLRLDRHGDPDIQAQPALGPSAEGGDQTWVDELLATVAERVLAEEFGPRPGDHCGPCEFRRACPAQPEGKQVVE
ncbi:MAG TPA: ATP-dependent DNA helicase [Actinomycetes bacterium]|nr:ATP-dependent DNA helicase [Actinomycetes bacterium]